MRKVSMPNNESTALILINASITCIVNCNFNSSNQWSAKHAPSTCIIDKSLVGKHFISIIKSLLKETNTSSIENVATEYLVFNDLELILSL